MTSWAVTSETFRMIDVQRIWSSAQLPTLPAVALKLVELSRSPNTNIDDIVEAIKSDPAIVVRLLKAANSSFFGLPSKVTSIDQAVILLGTTAVTAFALGFSLADTSLSHGPLRQVYADYWLQSTVQATAAKMLGIRQAAANVEDLFLAGLLLDLGKLAMLKTIPDEYQGVLDAAAASQSPLHEVETRLLGINHVDVGIGLMQRWLLPDALCQAVRGHHEPPDAFAPEAGPEHTPLVKTAAVAAAVGEYFCGQGKGLALERLRKLANTLFQLAGPELDVFLDDLRNHIGEIAGLFSVDPQSLATPAELLTQANEQLALLAIAAKAESAQAQARREAAEHEIRKLEVKHEQLREQALRDPLTRLYNRHFFDETLAREIQRCARSATPLGVIFFDADNFKQINDGYGHAFGDEVLKRVAAAAAETVRGSDVLARYGGEEFVIMVGQPTEKGLEKAAERIRQRVESAEIVHNGQRARVTISVGAALTIPERAGQTDGAFLVQAADECMYEAKQAGRNRVRFRNLMSPFNRQLVALVLQRRFSRWLVNKSILDLESVSRALLHCHTERVRLGDLARKFEMLSPAQVDVVRARQAQTGLRFGETAVRLEFLDTHQLAGLLAIQHENPRDLAVVLARLGMLEANRIQTLLDAYESEVTLAGQLQLQACANRS